MSKHGVTSSIAVLVLALCPLVASAQTDNAEVDEVQDTIDEITVLGQRTIGTIRAEMVAAEQVVYDMFNELNDDDDYDIICKKETRIGSQIPHRICLSRRYRDKLAEATVEESDGMQMTVGGMTSNKKHQKIMMEKMRALATAHPELLDALRERYRLESELKAERERRFGE